MIWDYKERLQPFRHQNPLLLHMISKIYWNLLFNGESGGLYSKKGSLGQDIIYCIYSIGVRDANDYSLTAIKNLTD